MTRGDAMRKARRSRGLSIKDLANAAGVSKGTIQSMETDVRNPSIVNVELCADALEMSLDEYVGHEVVRHNN